mmetsp:Transcript_30982/g.70839  ORF Transcript_30982/g.70839 Transcript_30982/m.70839 type:complete len:95 (+) Transcript_30982:914-1198(+)
MINFLEANGSSSTLTYVLSNSIIGDSLICCIFHGLLLYSPRKEMYSQNQGAPNMPSKRQKKNVILNPSSFLSLGTTASNNKKHQGKFQQKKRPE